MVWLVEIAVKLTTCWVRSAVAMPGSGWRDWILFTRNVDTTAEKRPENMRMPSMSPFQLSTRARSNFSAWVRHMDHISAELSTVGAVSVVIGGPSTVTAVGFTDILPGLGSVSREELREGDIVAVV